MDGVGARIAEGLGAVVMFFWVLQVAPGGVPIGPLNTAWMTWLTLATVIVWLGITQKMRIQVKKEQAAAGRENVTRAERECERFPDQCPCTTELGKGVP